MALTKVTANEFVQKIERWFQDALDVYIRGIVLINADGNQMGLPDAPVHTALQRKAASVSVTIANGANLSDEIDMSIYGLLLVHMPAAWTAANIGFKVSSTTDGTFLPLYDDLGNLEQIISPAADRAYSAPASLATAHFLKLWSQDGSGNNTNQGAARTLVVDVKG